MRAGKLGIVVLMLAIVGTLSMAWVMSMDVEEHEVTRYSELAEITTLFESQQTPTFTEYSPSTNYTGYYTDSQPDYFSGVTATTTSKPNQYRLDLPPLSDVSSRLDLSDVQYTSTPTMHYWAVSSSQITKAVNMVDLSDVVDSLQLDADTIIMTSDRGDYSTGGFFSFYVRSWLGSGAPNIMLRSPDVTGQIIFNESGALVPFGDASGVPTPILSASYDVGSRSVTLYTGADQSGTVGVYSISDVVVIWNNDHNGRFWLGNTGTVRAVDFPAAAYMDPSYGVQMEG